MIGWLGFYVFGSLHYSGLFYYAVPGMPYTLLLGLNGGARVVTVYILQND